MANEQTTVPLFVAAEVLTAADMNLSAGTGVPVFSNSTTRDAGFGGAGEKVLAEGQLCYLSDSNIVQYYDGAAWATVGPTASAVSAVDINRVNTSQSTSSTSFVGLTTAQTITMTTGTKALVLLNFIAGANIGTTARASVAVSGATTIAASDALSCQFDTPGSGYNDNGSSAYSLTLTAGSNTFTMQFRSSGASVTFSDRNMTIIAYS